MDGDLRLLMWVPPRRRGAGLQVVSRPGDIQPAHATAAGKVWLASLDDADLHREIGERPLPILGRSTITDPKALLREVARVRSRGYATNHEEHGQGYFAVAVPVVPPDGQGLLGSLGLTRPLTGGDFSIETLAEAAGRAARELGAVLPRGSEMASLAAGRSY
jgi:IclR family acetate operon transcriptional repressor